MIENNVKQSRPLLLVEDNDSHAELVLRSFEEFGLVNPILHVKDGEEALNYLFQRGSYSDPETSPRPTVVLLDLRLPKVNGLEVLKEIKSSDQTKAIPVVVLTSSDAENDISQAYDNSVNSYLVKPNDFEGFAKLMDSIGSYWLICNKHPRKNIN